MTEAWTASALEHEATGRAELRAGRWDAARTAFRRALADDELPEALEGLSWAAWWLDDSDGVFSARTRAHRLFRARGDAPGAARMAIWLAIDELDFRAAVAPAAGWLRRARRLLDDVAPVPEHGWLAFQEGYLAHADGDTDTARERGRSAAVAGRRHDVPDLEMLGLALEGAALVASAQVAEGMRHLDEAVAVALEADAHVPIASAWTFCLMVSACLRVADLDRATAWCGRVQAFAERFGSRYMLAFCRAEYGALHRWRGNWTQAGELLEASVEDFMRSRPGWASGPLASLAELRRRQGRRDEARGLLERAGHGAEAERCRAALALDDGRAGEAADLLERLLRRVPSDRLLDRAPALELLVQAQVDRGRVADAAAVLPAVRAAARAAGTSAMLAAAALADGRCAAAAGDVEEARPHLEAAVDGFDAVEAPYEAAQARLVLAGTLRALGRAEAAAGEERAALSALGALGAVHAAAGGGGAAAEPPEADGGVLAALSPREREVLDLVGEGLSNRQVAERLILSEHTVHRHVSNLLRKLGVPSRTAAAALAARATSPARRDGGPLEGR